MALYRVTYRDSRGKVLTTGDEGALDDIEVAGVGDLYSAIQSNGGQIISVRKMRKFSLQEWVDGLGKKKISLNPITLWRMAFGIVTWDEWAMLCDMLRCLLSAGISPVVSLRLVSADCAPSLRKTLLRVAALIENGSSLYGAMEAQGGKFPQSMVSAVRAGEKTGAVPAGLGKMAILFRRKAAIKRDLIKAAIYPVLCILVLIGVCGIMTFYVPGKIEEGIGITLTEDSPHFKDLLKPLQIVFRISHKPWLLFKWAVLGAIIGAMVFGLRQFRKGRTFVAKLGRKIPLIGNIRREFALVDFIESLSINQNSGIKLSESLELIRQTTGDVLIADAAGRVRDKVILGASLSDAIETEEDAFPGTLRQMIKSAEKSGRLGEMLDPVAEFYDLHARATLESAMNALEPSIIVGLATIVGPIVFSIYDMLQKVPYWFEQAA